MSMTQSAIWVVDDELDFRSHNKNLYKGREVLRQSLEDDRRQKVLEGREKRGLPITTTITTTTTATTTTTTGKQASNIRKRKYNKPTNEEVMDEISDDEQAGSVTDGGHGKELGVISLAELLKMEEPDYIDEEENAGLDAALATGNVEAVLAFTATLMTPAAQQVTDNNDEAHPCRDESQEHAESDALIENMISGERRDSATSLTPHAPTWSGNDNNADNDDADTQNEHWRKIQVRTPVDVPLDLLPAAQRLETLQVQEDMKIFSDESNKDAAPPKRYLRSAWWLPRSQWRVMDPNQPETLQNPHRARDFSAEGHTYLPMGRGLLQNGVSHEKMTEDDRKIAENEQVIANSAVGKRYKEYLIAEGFQDGKHLPHYLDACKITGESESSSRPTQRTISNKTVKLKKQAQEVERVKVEKAWNPSTVASSRTPRLPDIKTPRS